MASVFLSYSRVDQHFARKVVAALEANGCRIWWDALLEGGEQFSRTTAAELASADTVVVLWSKASVESHWVHDEASRGRDTGRLVPVSIDGTLPPLGFGQFQALGLSRWNGRNDAEEIKAIVRAITLISGGTSDPAGERDSRISNPNRRRVLVGSVATLALGAGGFGAWKSGWFGNGAQSHSVIVMPFRNLSGDPNQDYFADGLSEEVRNTLSRNPLLKVIASPSSKLLREQSQSYSEIAARLKVSHILDGSVRRDDAVMRISVSLFSAYNSSLAWSDTFDRQFENVLEVQTEIATKVARTLAVQTSGFGLAKDESDLAEGGTSIPAAFDAYIQGRFANEAHNDEGLKQALQHYERAWTIDPNYAAAYASHARALIGLVERNPDSPDARVLLSRALDLTTRAASAAPYSPSVRATRGWALIANMKFSDGLREIVKCYDEHPNDFLVLRTFARNASYIERFADARSAINRALVLDPLDAAPWLTKAWVEFWSGNSEQSIAAAEQIFQANPNFGSRDYLHYFHFANNLVPGKLELARRAASQVTEKFEREFEFAYIDALEDKPEKARTLLRATDNRQLEGTGAYNRLCLFAVLRDTQSVMSGLQEMHRKGDHNLISCRIDPFLNPVRHEPAFIKFVDRLGITV